MAEDKLVAAIHINQTDRKYLAEAYARLDDDLKRIGFKIEPRVHDDNSSLGFYAKGPFDPNAVKGTLWQIAMHLPQQKRYGVRFESYVQPTAVEQELQIKLHSLEGEKSELNRRLEKWKSGTSLEQLTGGDVSKIAPLAELSGYEDLAKKRLEKAKALYAKLDEAIQDAAVTPESCRQTIRKYLLSGRSEQNLQTAFMKRNKSRFSNLETVAEEAKTLEDNIAALDKQNLSPAVKKQLKDTYLRTLNELREKPDLLKRESVDFVGKQQTMLRELIDLFSVPMYARTYEEHSGCLFEIYVPITTDETIAELLDFDSIFSSAFIKMLRNDEYQSPKEVPGVDCFRAYVSRESLSKSPVRELWEIKGAFESSLEATRKRLLTEAAIPLKLTYEKKFMEDAALRNEPAAEESSESEGRLRRSKAEIEEFRSNILETVQTTNGLFSRGDLCELLTKKGIVISDPMLVGIELRALVKEGKLATEGVRGGLQYKKA